MTLTNIIPSLRASLRPPLDPARWPRTVRWSAAGRLSIGGCDVAELAAGHDGPLSVLDEADVRAQCGDYAEAFGPGAVAYAGQAGLNPGLARLIADAGVGCRVRTGGEVRMALAAGFAGRRLTLTGAGKSMEDCEIAYAGGATVVVGSPAEVASAAAHAPSRQPVLVRVVASGARSRYGFRAGSGPALAAVRAVLRAPNLAFAGLDCPVGHDISRFGRYEAVVREVMGFAAVLTARLRTRVPRLELAGGYADGFAVRMFALRMRALLRLHADRYGIAAPMVSVSPGHAVVSRAGVTLLRVATVTPSVDGRLVVAVHGALPECLPRTACAGRHGAVLASRVSTAEDRPATIVGQGREAEQPAVSAPMPCDVVPGDVVAVPATGAYHHGGLGGRPPLVGVQDGRQRILDPGRTWESLLLGEASMSA
jgi:diaminopimelate decarboxylase